MEWPGGSSEVTEGQLRSTRSMSPPILPPPPPDLPLENCHHNSNVKPCFSEKTRDLFRQKLIRKRNLRPPVSVVYLARPLQLCKYLEAHKQAASFFFLISCISSRKKGYLQNSVQNEEMTFIHLKHWYYSFFQIHLSTYCHMHVSKTETFY